MKMKRDTKFGEKSTRRLKIGIRNLTNFDLSTWMSQKFSIQWAPFEQSRRVAKGKGGLPPAQLKQVQFALSIKHASFDAMP